MNGIILRYVVLTLPVTAWAQHPARGTATDVTGAEIEGVVEKHLSDSVSDQQVRVVSIDGEYNVGVGVMQRARTTGVVRQSGIEHHLITEIYHVISGSATFVTGGTLEKPREYTADSPVVTILNGPSSGGGAILNGVSRRLGPGDVVVIPPNTPHWFSEVFSDQIIYLVIRMDPHKVLPAGYILK